MPTTTQASMEGAGGPSTQPKSKPQRTLTCACIYELYSYKNHYDRILLLWHKLCYVFQRLVVCLEESIYIHNIKDMKLLKTLLNTPSNSSGKVESASWHMAIRPIKRIENTSANSKQSWPVCSQH